MRAGTDRRGGRRFPEIKPLPKSVPEGDIDLRGGRHAQAAPCAPAAAWLPCVACQLVAAPASA